jgi:hypothetical protein
MTLQEVKDWMKGTPIETWEHDSYDDNGNHYETRIYRKDGKFWRLEFSNEHPYEHYERERGYVRGEYVGPVEVVKKTRVVTETYYESKEEEEQSLNIETLQSARLILEGRGSEVSEDSPLGRHVGNSEGN